VNGSLGGELRSRVIAAAEQLEWIPDATASLRPAPGKWSPKEVIGHLIDSACNNHARFVRSRLEDGLEFPGYEQDAWVTAQDYMSADWAELVTLWRAYNLHIARIIDLIPADVLVATRPMHNLDVIAWRTVPREQPVTLEYFIRDYIAHLEHHLEQIKQLQPRTAN